MRAGEKRGSQSEVVRVWGYIIKKKFQEWIQTSPIRQTCSKLVCGCECECGCGVCVHYLSVVWGGHGSSGYVGTAVVVICGSV